MTAIGKGANIAVPIFEGRRGNPVVFVREHPVFKLEVDDPRVLCDIDIGDELQEMH